MNNINLQVELKRNFSARLALDNPEKKIPGWLYSELTAITFCGFAIEAIANSFGESFVSNWKDFENPSPTAKLRIVCKELKIDYKSDEEPWAKIKWILKFRNKVAHVKIKIIDENVVWSAYEYDDRRKHLPKLKLEKMISPENVRMAYDASKKILKILCNAILPEQSLGLRNGWSGSSSAIKQVLNKLLLIAASQLEYAKRYVLNQCRRSKKFTRYWLNTRLRYAT